MFCDSCLWFHGHPSWEITTGIPPLLVQRCSEFVLIQLDMQKVTRVVLEFGIHHFGI